MIFGWEQREENNNVTRNSSRSDILTLLTLLSADAKWAVLLRVPSITKVEVRKVDFPLLHFPKWLSLFHAQLAMSLRRVKRSVTCKCQFSVSLIFNSCQFYLKYYFLRHRNSPSKRFSWVSIAASLFSIFVHQNTKNTTGLNIYSIL